ncbi:hypothetical protein STRZYGA_00390 [Brevundimonas phage vB_BpoS-Strzyga]|nr:hypothetical protein STRZYGA_00390 [Brevundimonas phage vB_BpoS-Strzyga]
MLAAITTRFHGPQGNRGSRICARSKSGRIIVGYDHSKSCDENHAEAAKELARRNGWCGSWYGGALPDRGDRVWVLTSIQQSWLGEKFTIEGGPE